MSDPNLTALAERHRNDPEVQVLVAEVLVHQHSTSDLPLGASGPGVIPTAAMMQAAIAAAVTGVHQVGATAGQTVDASVPGLQLLTTVPIAPGAVNHLADTLRWWNILRIQATDTLTSVSLTYKMGPYTLGTTPPVVPTATGRVQMVDVTFTTVTTGVAGRLDGRGVVSNSTFGAPPASINVMTPQPFLPVADLTGPLDVSVYVLFGAVTAPGLNVVWNEGLTADVGPA